MSANIRPAITNVALSSEAESFISGVPVLWPGDETVTECERCATPFTFFTRRHRCRDCFSILCAECTPHRVPLPYRPVGVNGLSSTPGDKQRVCSYCWFFIDLHQRQEHDRQNEARRMQLRAQDESLMSSCAVNEKGSVEQLRSHMRRELIGRNRAALEKRSTRSQAATSTKWSGSDDDGDSWAVAVVPAADSKFFKENDNICFRNNIVDPQKQWAQSAKKAAAAAGGAAGGQQAGSNTAALKEALMGPVGKMPSPALGLFLELSERCGVNLSLDTTSAVGQSVVASTSTNPWHRVTEENLMEESSIVGVAAYFRVA